MNNNIELLSPVGDFECLKAAVQNGANSVYFGSNLFNARASATNFDFDELEKTINYCALRNVKTHLTLNILIKDSEFEEAVMVAKKAYELGIDALIVQDIGLARFLMKLFPNLPIHASTQMTVHNLEGVKKLEELGYSRAVLSRELSISEIEYICNNCNIEIETFIHGALCISYSGQCLFSSMVGGRSGNRGKCAQPCRLPYELVEETTSSKTTSKVIDKGYLISPRDLCSLEFIPHLIKAGVKCFKIEGRLKSPEYVATVTRIYRKYIDMVLNKQEYKISENDLLDLKQIFNRGGFSSGHLSNKANRDLIFKDKPNNMGLYLGNVAGYNKLKGHVKLSLNEKLSIGDSISFEKENTKYTVSELMINNSNISTAEIGQKVVIGRMKGNIHIGDKIYKISSKSLIESAVKSYSAENIKLPLNAIITVKKGEPVLLEAWIHSNEPLYKGIRVKLKSNLIPEKALKAPTSIERIITQLQKTSDTPFSFDKITTYIENDVFIPSIKELNELRRMAIFKIENMIIDKHKRASLSSKIDISTIYTDLKKFKYNNDGSKKIIAYLNVIHPNFDYSKIMGIGLVYIPLRYFMRKDCINSLKTITSNFKTYIYMPAIIKSNYKNIIKHSLEGLVNEYNISGFVISSLGDLILLDKYLSTYETVGNFTLNNFNINSINVYKSLGINRITISPELNLDDINKISNTVREHIPLELIVYGRIPVMKMNYCLLGCSNKCYPTCQMRCSSNNKYYLRDRLGLNFRLLPDNIQTVTTIFNSKTTCITDVNTTIDFLRLDFLDESVDEMNEIINIAKAGKKLEGNEYTHGNLNRDV